MAVTSLQFEGVENAPLLAVLGAAIAVSVLAYGLWRTATGRRDRTAAHSLIAGALALAAVLLAAVYLPMDSPGRQLLWMALLGAVVVAAVAIFYATVYAYLGRRRISMLLVLRCLGILALLLILFKPALSHQPSPDSARLVLPVLVDRSGSMDTLDHPDLPNRYRQAVEALSAQHRRMEKHFRVSWRHFADRPQSVDEVGDLNALSPTGEGTEVTDLAAAIRQASAGYRADELAGVILITDGLHNGEGNVIDAARESPVPIYTLGLGSETESSAGQRNVRLVNVEAPLQAVRNNVAKIAAQVRLTGWANIPAKVALRAGGNEIDARQVLTDANAKTLTVEFKWTPGEAAGAPEPDIRKLHVAAEPNPAEANADDNAAELHVLVTQPSIRVLYVEGTLRPEYKYLRRILSTDPNVKLMSLVRMSANRFLSQGSIEGKRLTDLPRSDEEFGFFDVLILGDLDRTFLKRDQMEKIRQFVNDGKSLLMLGGRNSFGPGGYGGTPVETALPVLCGSRSAPQETTRFVPQLTAAGQVSPVFADLGEFFGAPGRKPVKALPELLGCVTAAAAKPGAQVLAIHPTRRNDSGPLVVLAVHNFGAGRAGAFTADTTWRWYLRVHALGADSPYHRFWGQLIRYLAGVKKTQKQTAPAVLARLDRAYLRQGEELKITALVKDADGQPTNDATVTATLAAEGDDKPVETALQRSTRGAGLYEAAHTPAASGPFTVTVKARDKLGKLLASDELPLRVARRSKETDRLARDAKMLKAIATARGGRYAELAALPDVVDGLIQRKQTQLLPAPPGRQVRLYNFALLFFIFIGLLTVEWFLRRNWQLQ